MSIQHLYIILYRGDRYLDFSTIHSLCNSTDNSNKSSRATLWRYLRNKRKIKSVEIRNQRIYLVDDLLSDSVLIGKMLNIEALANALED